MKFSKKHFKAILVCLFELLAGLLVAINAKGFTKTIVIIAGFGLILYGALLVIRYYRAEPVTAAKRNYLMKGLLTLSIGCFCAFRSNWFFAVLPSFSFLLGAGMFVVGLMKIQQAMDMTRMDNKQWYLAFIGATVSLACAATILSGPSATKKVLWLLTGILLILVAAADTAMLLMLNTPKKSKAVAPVQDEVSLEEIPAEEIPAEEINL